MRVAPALAALIVLGGATTVHAQQAGKAPPSKPQVIIIDRDRLRPPPPSPATRPYPPPSPEIGRPMEPLPSLPQMTPRVGN